MITDKGVLPLAMDLVACLTNAVKQLPTVPKHVGFRPGTQADLLMAQRRNECCEGLAWVRPVQVFPSSSFPLPDQTIGNCGVLGYAAVLELGIARCAPIGDANELPSDDEWNNLTETVLTDAAALRTAICAWSEMNPDTLYLPGTWQPLPTSGGCAGGLQTITIKVQACEC